LVLLADEKSKLAKRRFAKLRSTGAALSDVDLSHARERGTPPLPDGERIARLAPRSGA
jgi:hypothetical protein